MAFAWQAHPLTKAGLGIVVSVAPGDMVHRVGFRFSARGEHAACLTIDGDGRIAIEAWSFERGHADVRRVDTAAAVVVPAQVIPAEDGRIVLLRPGSGTHEVTVITPSDSGGHIEHRVTTVRAEGLRAFPSPDPAVPAMLVSYTDSRTVIQRLTDEGLEPVVGLPGMITKECRLTPDGRQLAANQIVDGERRAVVLDLTNAAVTPFAHDVGAVLLSSPATGDVLVAVDTPDGVKLGWLTPGDAHARVPGELNDIEGVVLPLAVDPAGDRLALKVTDGARSRLLIHERRTGKVREQPIPPGVIGFASAWTEGALRVSYSAPTHPSGVLAVDPSGTAAEWAEGHDTPETLPWCDARLERFDGPAGTMEAVVYGPDWRHNKHVLIALHGGPEAAWDLSFDPTLQRFAQAGISVIAPNQRGSTGYGAAHRAAIVDQWGGPDLADIRHLLAAVNTARHYPRHPAPMLFGASYGAFLALLAAAADPPMWSSCAVVGPFLSGSRLYADGSPAVRSLLDRLGGCTDLDDDLGPRDLLRLGPQIQAPLMVIHGEHDDVIPVEHSRALAQRLTADRRFIYREIAGGEHYPLSGRGGSALLDEVVDFLLSSVRDNLALATQTAPA
ncbi:pimeloyl-ACP methyl ester carboxylesterase [Thermocatellispora tengchongensis]|uniref:Pimeloyl-ACP methyl ester carboxylesterase n=1 Tax=Thermocatellispora tengchongensis TaxID=1073253 RepID=A0A840PDI3_9ACTN|nr:prolyl oligopeptidase family serine peptidase [Thermocatellispora tengchongensis]MBB5137272.1 pimeloyl-ACP methyl ester carboxylesterase [Thermocatellispora tengchongensis]